MHKTKNNKLHKNKVFFMILSRFLQVKELRPYHGKLFGRVFGQMMSKALDSIFALMMPIYPKKWPYIQIS